MSFINSIKDKIIRGEKFLLKKYATSHPAAKRGSSGCGEREGEKEMIKSKNSESPNEQKSNDRKFQS